MFELVGLEVGVLSASSAGVAIRPPLGRRHRRPGMGAGATIALQARHARPRRAAPAGRRPGRPRRAARWASDAVVSGTPRGPPGARAGRAGYCSATGLRQPAEDTSAAMPRGPAASAIRSQHSAGAAGTCPATLTRSGWASTSHTPRRRQLLHGRACTRPTRCRPHAPTTRPWTPRRRGRRSATPRPSAPSPAARRRGSRPGARPPRPSGPVVVDLEPEHHREPGLLGRQRHLHVGVEVGPGVVVPVRRPSRPPAGAAPGRPQNPPSSASAWAKAEQVLGERDLGHAGLLRPSAVRGHLLEPQRHVAAGRAATGGGGSRAPPARPLSAGPRISVTPSRTVVCTHTTRGSSTTLSLNARRARCLVGSLREVRTRPPYRVLSTTISPWRPAWAAPPRSRRRRTTLSASMKTRSNGPGVPRGYRRAGPSITLDAVARDRPRRCCPGPRWRGAGRPRGDDASRPWAGPRPWRWPSSR